MRRAFDRLWQTLRPAVRAAFVPASCLFFATSCGRTGALGKGFDTNWQRKDGSEGRAVISRLQGATAPARKALVVGVSGRELVGKTLPDGETWRHQGDPNVLPSVSGGTVAFTNERELVVLEGVRGRELFRVASSGRRLEGYSFDGTHAVLLLVDQDDARPDLVRIVDTGGRTIAESQTVDRVGGPLAINGLALVPWANQYVSAFELATGAYVGRLVARSAPNSVVANASGIFLTGGGGLVQLGPELAERPDVTAPHFDAKTLPGQPEWPIDGSKPRLLRAAPITAVAEPTSREGRAAFVGDRTAVSYFELVSALSVETLAPIWVNHLPRSVVGSAANASGVLYCLEDGSLVTLSWATGSDTTVGSLGARLKACAVDPGSLDTPSTSRATLETQIVEAIRSSASTMGTFQDFLVERLGRVATREATVALLAVARDPLTPAPLRQRANRELARREVGLDVLIAAVVESVQPLEGGGPGAGGVTRAVPIAELAQALERGNQKAAAEPLSRHLASPNLSGETAAAILGALLVLGGESETRAVLEFLRANKNVATNEQLRLALERATRFLLRQGGQAALDAEAAIADPMTHPELRAELLRVVAEERPTPAPKSGPSGSERKAP